MRVAEVTFKVPGPPHFKRKLYCSVAAKAEVAKVERVLFPLLVRFDVAAAAV